MFFDHLGHEGIRLAIETAIEQLGGIDEKLIDGHSQSFGQTVERAGVRLVARPEGSPESSARAGRSARTRRLSDNPRAAIRRNRFSRA